MAIHPRDYLDLDCTPSLPQDIPGWLSILETTWTWTWTVHRPCLRMAIHRRDYLDCTPCMSQDIPGWLPITGTTWTVHHPCLRISQDGYQSQGLLGLYTVHVSGYLKMAIHHRDYLDMDCIPSVSQDIQGWPSTVHHQYLRTSQDAHQS